MKIGDKVYHKNREGVATIIQSRVLNVLDYDATGKIQVRTEYLATYEDGSPLIFYGFNIGKTVFKYEPNEQLSFLDLLK